MMALSFHLSDLGAELAAKRSFSTFESRQHLDAFIAKLHEFEKNGLNEMALAVEGDPVFAIKLLGEKVLPLV
jgi:hypothetical protein